MIKHALRRTRVKGLHETIALKLDDLGAEPAKPACLADLSINYNLGRRNFALAMSSQLLLFNSSLCPFYDHA